MRRKAQELSTLFQDVALTPNHCAHLAIDVQTIYCSWRHGRAVKWEGLEKIAAHIGETIAPAFNAAGIKTYWLWMNKQRDTPDFYKANPAPRDETMKKDYRSGFKNTDLDQRLAKMGVRTLFLSGFYAEECIFETALDGVHHGYRVFICQDGTNVRSWSRHHTEAFRKHNIGLVESAAALRLIPAPAP